MKNFSLLKIILIALVVLAACSLLEWRIFSANNRTDNTSECSEDGNYKYVNSWVACQLSERDLIKSFDALRYRIEDFVNYSLKEEKAKNISVFMRDLKSRRWLGVNENENYSPASLLKLPLLIAYYELSEVQPDILLRKYIYRGQSSTPNDIQDIKPESKLEEGKEYTSEELLYRMIVYSDNETVGPLFNFIGSKYVNEIFTDLGIYVPVSGGMETDFLSPKIYAAIFRSLYNSIFLRPENSEKILDLLTKTTFKDGLVAGVPEQITVAHKFGEREIKDSATGSVIRNLYDCGIVYDPEHPYILCVMTRGQDWENLKEIIKNISRLVYEEMKD